MNDWSEKSKFWTWLCIGKQRKLLEGYWDIYIILEGAEYLIHKRCRGMAGPLEPGTWKLLGFSLSLLFSPLLCVGIILSHCESSFHAARNKVMDSYRGSDLAISSPEEEMNPLLNFIIKYFRQEVWLAWFRTKYPGPKCVKTRPKEIA